MKFSKIWSILGAKDQSLGVFCLGGFLKSHFFLFVSILCVLCHTSLAGGRSVCIYVGAYIIGLWVELSLF